MTSLIWGALLDNDYQLKIISFTKNTHDLPNLIGLAAAGGLLVFTSGYMIGTITYFFSSNGFSTPCHLIATQVAIPRGFIIRMGAK
jgi:hypothetical protein